MAKTRVEIPDFEIPNEYLEESLWYDKINKLMSRLERTRFVKTDIGSIDPFYITHVGYRSAVRVEQKRASFPFVVRYHNALKKLVERQNAAKS
jgi:hypothetical protein